MSCRESDSHMTEASRCGPHTASSECSCAYAPPSPFPNSPASRGQTIPAGRWRTLDAFSVQRHACSPTTARPLACMPVQWHACMRARQQPVRPHHVCPHVVPTAPPHSPLHSPSLSMMQTRGPRFTGPRFTGPRFTGPRFTQVAARTRRQLLPRRSRMHAFRRWRRAHHGAEPTTARSRPELLHQAWRPPRRGAHHGALTTRAPASGGPAPAYASHSPRLQRRSSAHASRSPR